MVPIPQYPLYSATIAEYGLAMAPYFLDEGHGWGLKRDEMERAYKEALGKGMDVRAIVVINPGNPTGQVCPAFLMESSGVSFNMIVS